MSDALVFTSCIAESLFTWGRLSLQWTLANTRHRQYLYFGFMEVLQWDDSYHNVNACLSFVVNMRLCLLCVDRVPGYGCRGAHSDNAVFKHSCILKVECTVLDAEEESNAHHFWVSATKQGICSFRRYMLSFKYQNDAILDLFGVKMSTCLFVCVCFLNKDTETVKECAKLASYSWSVLISTLRLKAES